MITNEIKAKVFVQYWGQRVLLVTPTKLEAVYSRWNLSHPDFKLKLKPLSQISDEDAIEVAKLAGISSSYNNQDYVIEAGKSLVSNYLNKQSNIHGLNWLRSFQFLQSKGYDLPHYLLGNKTLHECGLAIYESDNTVKP